jgi:SepF-like predicted cell division protein (DUF552 family)
MIGTGDKVVQTATRIADAADVDRALCELTAEVIDGLRKQAKELHGWRMTQFGADEVLGVPTAIKIVSSMVRSGTHMLLTVDGSAVVDEIVLDTRFLHDED